MISPIRTSNHFQNLVLDTQATIFGQLNLKDFLHCTEVCKSWNHLIQINPDSSNDLWQRVFQKTFPSSSFLPIPAKNQHFRETYQNAQLLYSNLTKGLCNFKTFCVCESPFVSLATLGNQLILAEAGTIAIWNLENKTYEMKLIGHTSTVSSLTTWNDKIISGSEDKTIKIWNIHPSNLKNQEFDKEPTQSKTDSSSCLGIETRNCEMTLEGHTNVVSCLDILNNKIISGSYDHTVKIWNIENGTCEITLKGHTNAISCLALVNNEIISGSFDGTIKIWNAESGTCRITLQDHGAYISSLTIWNNKIISGSGDSTIRIWDSESGICEAVLSVSQNTISWTTSLISTNDILISADNMNQLAVWDLKSKTSLKILPGTRLSFIPDSKLVMTNGKLIYGFPVATLNIPTIACIQVWDFNKIPQIPVDSESPPQQEGLLHQLGSHILNQTQQMGHEALTYTQQLGADILNRAEQAVPEHCIIS